MSSNDIVGVFGRRGSGKSVYLRYLATDYPRVLVFDAYSRWRRYREFGTLRGLADAALETPDSYHLTYVTHRPEEKIGGFSDLAVALGNSTVVLDEADAVAPVTDRLGDDSGLGNLLARGRHSGVNLLFGSQRPANVNRMLTAQASKLVFFQLVDPRDHAFAAEYGVDAQQLLALGRGEHIVVDLA